MYCAAVAAAAATAVVAAIAVIAVIAEHAATAGSAGVLFIARSAVCADYEFGLALTKLRPSRALR